MIPPKHHKWWHNWALAASQTTQPGFATSDGSLGASETMSRRNRMREDGRSASGEAALLRLPGGAGWRFRASGGRLGVSEDVYLGVRGKIKRSEQIVVTGRLEDGEAVVKWAFRRVGRP